MRCCLNIGQRRGEVKYVGKVKELGPGYWIGVQLDEPSGDSNGSVKGKVYFEANNKFGVFARPADLVTGDFPCEDEFDDDLDEI